MAVEATSARELEVERKQKEAEATNKARTGKGTRVKVGSTRGKNPQVIQFEAFDESQPDTLPTSVAEFAEITKTPDEKLLVEYLITGYNDAQYTQASDPVAEYLNPMWDGETVLQFRTAVRNYSRGAEVPIEDAAALLKPGIDKAWQKRQTANA